MFGGVSGLGREDYEGKVYDEKYPCTILKFSSRDEKRGLHPTQKPVALMEYLIKTYTNENETVLDLTMGSGTTGVACMNTNRKFIGIERDDKYFDISVKRIRGELLKHIQFIANSIPMILEVHVLLQMDLQVCLK